MKIFNNIYIIGAGAIGTAYGSKLFDADPEAVKIIANKERIERYKKNGFIINGKKYNFNYISPDEKASCADLIIVAVKFHHLEEVIKDIKNFVGENTIIMSLLNGISSEEIIGRKYGMDKLIYSMCIAIDAQHKNNNISYSNIGKICLGDIDNAHSEQVQKVAELLKEAEIEYEISDNILKTLWWKFMINVGINQTSAVLKAPYKTFQTVLEAKELMQDSMKEVIALSKKLNINLDESDMDKFTEVLMTLSPEGKTSMLQDVEAKRKTEVEMFAGKICELGKKYNVPTPVNDSLFKMIKTIEKTY